MNSRKFLTQIAPKVTLCQRIEFFNKLTGGLIYILLSIDGTLDFWMAETPWNVITDQVDRKLHEIKKIRKKKKE